MKTFEFIVENATLIEPYFNIFNTIAVFFNDPTYLEILKIAFLLGGFYAFLIAIASIFRMSLSFQNTQVAPFKKFSLLISYILGVFFLLTMSYYKGKVDVVIKTNKIDTYCSLYTKQDYHTIVTGKHKLASGMSNAVVVGNIPYLWAWVFTSINETGRTLTNFANSSFREGTDAQINRGNYVDYLHAASGILSMKLSDLTPTALSSTGKYDTITILEAVKKDCISIPSSKAPFLSEDILDGVNKSGDIIRTLDGYFTKGELRLFKNPTDPTGELMGSNIEIDGTAPGNYLVTVGDDTYRCKALWDNFKKDIEAINKEQGGICHGALYSYLTPENISIFTGDRKTKVSAPQTNNIILQAAMINQFMEQKTKLPSEITFASGKSMAQITLNSAGTGFYMAKMLPYIQMSLRAVLYAFFPFIFIVMIFPYGLRVLGQYLRTLIWIELWMPIAAVLNMFIMFGVSEKFKILYDGAGLNIANSIQVFSEAFIMAGVAGYLFAFVPAIAWLILNGSDQMLGRITSNGLAQVSANFESQTINEDVRTLSRFEEYNNLRKKKGEELVSMAEQDMQRAEIKGKQDAGEYVAKLENSDKLSLAAYGKKEEELLKSIEKGNFLLSGNSAKNSIMAKESMSLNASAEYLKSLNVLNEDGTINKDKLNAFAKSIGIEKSISDLTAQQFQDQAEVARRVQAGIIQKQKELGQNEGVVSALKEGLKVLATEGNAEASKLIKRLDEGDDRAVSESFKLLAPYGEFGNQYNKNVSDKIAKALFAAGFGTENKGGIDVSSFSSEVFANVMYQDIFEKTKDYKDNTQQDKGNLNGNEVSFEHGVEASADITEFLADDIQSGAGDNSTYVKKSIMGSIRKNITQAYNQTIQSLSTFKNYKTLLDEGISKDSEDKVKQKDENSKDSEDKVEQKDKNFKDIFVSSKLFDLTESAGAFLYHSHSPVDELNGSPRNAMISMLVSEGMLDIQNINTITNIPFAFGKKMVKGFAKDSKKAGKIVDTITDIKSSLVISGLAVPLMGIATDMRAELLKEKQMQKYRKVDGYGNNISLMNYSNEGFVKEMSDTNKTLSDKAEIFNFYVYSKIKNSDSKTFSEAEVKANKNDLIKAIDGGALNGHIYSPYDNDIGIMEATMLRGEKDAGQFFMSRVDELLNFIKIGGITADTEYSYQQIQKLIFQLQNDEEALKSIAASPLAPAIQEFIKIMGDKNKGVLFLNEMRKNSLGEDGGDKTAFKEAIDFNGFLNKEKSAVSMLTLAFTGFVKDLDNIDNIFKGKSQSYLDITNSAKTGGSAVFTGIDMSKGYADIQVVHTSHSNISTDKNADIAFSPKSTRDEVVNAVLNGFIDMASSKQIDEIKNMPVLAVQEIAETISRLLYENKISDPIQRANAEKVLNILADIHSGKGTILDQRDTFGKDKWIKEIGAASSISFSKNTKFSELKSESVDFNSTSGFGSGLTITKAVSRIINDSNYVPTQYSTDFDEKNKMFTRGFFENKSHSISNAVNNLLIKINKLD